MTVRSASTRRLAGLRPLLATAVVVSIGLALFAAASSSDVSELVATSPDPGGPPSPTSTTATVPSEGSTATSLRAPSSTVTTADVVPTEVTPQPAEADRSDPEPSDGRSTTTSVPARSEPSAAQPTESSSAATTPTTALRSDEPDDGEEEEEASPTTVEDRSTASTGAGDEPDRSAGTTAEGDQADPSTVGAGDPSSAGGADGGGTATGDALAAERASDDSGLSLQTVVSWLIAVLGALGVASLLVPAFRSLAERWGRRDRSDSWWRALLRLLVGRDRPDSDPDGELVARPVVLDPIVVLDRLRQELEGEPHPRQAVRRAYAAAESGFGNPDLARRSTETPGRYLVRTLGSIGETPAGGQRRRGGEPTAGGSHAALSGLTELFLLARYSDHAVTEDMRHEAIEAVLELRSHYRRTEAVPA